MNWMNFKSINRNINWNLSIIWNPLIGNHLKFPSNKKTRSKISCRMMALRLRDLCSRVGFGRFNFLVHLGSVFKYPQFTPRKKATNRYRFVTPRTNLQKLLDDPLGVITELRVVNLHGAGLVISLRIHVTWNKSGWAAGRSWQGH